MIWKKSNDDWSNAKLFPLECLSIVEQGVCTTIVFVNKELRGVDIILEELDVFDSVDVTLGVMYDNPILQTVTIREMNVHHKALQTPSKSYFINSLPTLSYTFEYSMFN